jgi:DNA-binding CsgD family transcriptional regulator
MSSSAVAVYLLTAEERTALSLSATGLIVAEVADALGVSPILVRARLASAINKLGAHSKLEAVIIAARRGDLDLAP